jgi:hypothetical protein
VEEVGHAVTRMLGRERTSADSDGPAPQR